MDKQDGPNWQFMAEQLRKPSGDFAGIIAARMDRFNEFLYDLTAETMQPQDGETLLEVGFGSGSYMNRLFAAADIKLHGIDFSPEMADMATANNREPVEAGKLELAVGSSDEMPYADGTFDKVFCNMVVFFWEDPAAHLQEIRRVLKPGGTFYTGMRTKTTMQQFPFTAHGFRLYEPEEWRAVLEQNGFAYVAEKRKSDPPLESDGQTIRLESVCLAAQKPEGSTQQ